MHEPENTITPVDAKKLELLAVMIENVPLPDLETASAIDIASPVDVQLWKLAETIRVQLSKINNGRLRLTEAR